MEQNFIELLSEILEKESSTVKLEDTFRDYDEWDSLANLSVIAMLDDEYDVHIESKDFKNLITVGDLMNEVQNRKG
jgi:acyl carrier protein